MSPEVVFRSAVRAAANRARVLIAAESAALGAAVAAFSAPAGVAVAVVVSAWRARRGTRAAVVKAIERSDPAWRNVLVTTEELLSGALSAPEHVRARVVSEAAARIGAVRPARVYPMTRLAVYSALAVAAWALSMVWHTRAGVTRAAAVVASVARTGPSATSASGLHIRVDVEPPAYTGLTSSTVEDPTELRVIEGSAATFRIVSGAEPQAIEHDGAAAPARIMFARSGYVMLSAGDRRRIIPVTVTRDALPDVRIAVPGRDLIYQNTSPRVTFDVESRDDFGLRSLALRYTKVSGSGEQFDFTEGEIPLTIERRSPRDWKATATRTLAELKLADGDMLVYRAVASDARPSGGEASSDAFFIEVSKLGAAAGDAFTIPEEETRYALSQQMLIVKTQRLQQQQPTIAADALREQAMNLAVEQRMIRSEFVFMLGGEVEDEEAEAEQSTELQEGRLANRGQRDLRAATVAMSRAEAMLTAVNVPEALTAERAAVEALQRAFARDRYILRALATQSRLDPTRRLTGTVPTGAWRRQLIATENGRRAIRLQDLLRDLGEVARRAESGAAVDPNRIGTLAAEAIRIDARSNRLRDAASDLQRLADTWTQNDAAARSAALSRAAAVVAREVRDALADPPAIVGGAR